MAYGKRDMNIFRVLSKMESALSDVQSRSTMTMTDAEIEAWSVEQRRFLVDGEDVRVVFVGEFREFLFSCEWTKSHTTVDIVGYIKNGTPIGKIAPLVGVKDGAFRLRMMRITERINELVFGGHACPEGVYMLTDLGAIKKALVRLRLVSEPVVMDEEFLPRQSGWLNAHVEGIESASVGRENMDAYFKSVLALALMSRTFVLNLIDDTDPETLYYALQDMRAEGANSTKLLFSLLLKRLSSSSVSCEEELALVKREYREFMKD